MVMAHLGPEAGSRSQMAAPVENRTVHGPVIPKALRRPARMIRRPADPSSPDSNGARDDTGLDTRGRGSIIHVVMSMGSAVRPGPASGEPRPPGGRVARHRPTAEAETDLSEPAGSPAGFLFRREESEVSARVGVFGATGYAGRELVRLLRRHPRARVAFTTGSEARPPRARGRARAGGRRLPPGAAARRRRELRRAPARDAAGGGRDRPLRRPAPADARELPAVVRPRAQGPAAARPGRLRPHRGLPGSDPGRPARLEPGLLRDLRAAAARSAAARRPDRRGGHRRRRQERRDRRRPHAARGPALLRAGRRLLGLLARPRPPPRRRDRGRAGRARRAERRADLLPAPAAGQARHPDGALREAEGDPTSCGGR